MCYSAQIWADYRKFAKVFGATISIQDFVRLYWERGNAGKARIPKAMDAAFANPLTDLQHQIKGLIAFFNERVDLEVDGERSERPRTQWSP